MEPQKADQLQYQVAYVYEIMENLDKLEGHGAYETAAYVNSEDLAKEIAHSDNKASRKIVKRAAIFLSDGNVFLLAESSPILVQTTSDDTIRSIALSKLSPEERQSLGL